MQPKTILISEKYQVWWPANDGPLLPCSQPLWDSQVEQILDILGFSVAKSLVIRLDALTWDDSDSEYHLRHEGGTISEEQATAIKEVVLTITDEQKAVNAGVAACNAIMTGGWEGIQ